MIQGRIRRGPVARLGQIKKLVRKEQRLGH